LVNEFWSAQARGVNQANINESRTMKFNFAKAILCAMLVSTFSSNEAWAQNTPKVGESLPSSITAISPIFGELFAHNLPTQFKAQAEQTRGNFYLRSVILASDQSPMWTQRILVTGSKDLAKQADSSAKLMAQMVARNFQQACPTTFSGGIVLDGKTPTGHDMYIMLVNCGTHTETTTKAPTSETTLIAAIRGNLNYYTVQWSERGAPMDKAPVPDIATWGARLKSIVPFYVCELKAGEAAPYPSCFSTKHP